MAISIGSQPASAPAPGPKLAPYWERLSPLDDGYTLTEDGRPIGRVRVFDDREADGRIHVQFGEVRRGGKVTVFHFASLACFDDLLTVLADHAREQLRANGKKAKP